MMPQIFYFLMILALIKGQEYCQHGPSVYPWEPYRCPPFLQLVSNEARENYTNLVNNREIPWRVLKEEMLKWGNENNVQTAVQTYFADVSNYLKELSKNVTIYLGLNINFSRNDNITEHDKYHALLRFFLNQEPRIVSLVRAYTNLGKNGPNSISTTTKRPASGLYSSQMMYPSQNIPQTYPSEIFNQPGQPYENFEPNMPSSNPNPQGPYGYMPCESASSQLSNQYGLQQSGRNY